MVFMYANALVGNGADVAIYFLCRRNSSRVYIPGLLHRAICRQRVRENPRWFPLDPRVQKACIFKIDKSSILDADDVVATAAVTWRDVYNLPPSKGKKHYLIQGYESWDLPERELIESYRAGMSNIVVSDWLFDTVAEASGKEPTLIKNPIDERIFYPDPDIKRDDKEIAALYHTAQHKGFSDLYEALTIVKSEIPDIHVNVFGTPARPDWLPDWFRYTCNANQKQLREIYSRSAIYAGATVNEGFGLTYAEAMFCGCALAATRYKGVLEFANEDCAMLSPVHRPEAMAENIIEMLTNPSETKKLAARGREHAMSECSLLLATEKILNEFGL